jgi:hypothetical protein
MGYAIYIYVHIRSGVFLSGGFPWNADGRGLIRLVKEGVQAREGKERKKTVIDMLVANWMAFWKGGDIPVTPRFFLLAMLLYMMRKNEMILNLSKLLDWKLAIVRHLKKADMVNELMCLILL